VPELIESGPSVGTFKRLAQVRKNNYSQASNPSIGSAQALAGMKDMKQSKLF